MADRTRAAFSPVLASLASIHREMTSVADGSVATYIPELAKANPNHFGICLATTNGAVYEVGDTAIPFTIQSISKPFVYGLALEDNGRASVLEKVGVEPTGDAFNSISLEPGSGRPRNPMINAGAIATTGLVAASTPAHRFDRILEALSRYCGRSLGVDEAVYQSENETGHRNRAIGHMLRNFGILESDPIPVVEAYFRQCAISVTCRDLGIMAATLANRGVNPITGKQALRGEYVESVLSVMETCGMYDSAGRWVFEIGMPAKSGVAGGIIAVLPGQVGIGVFSPPLDPQGNSVRGIRVCRDLSRYLDLHLLNRPAIGRLAVRRRLTGADFGSNRIRTPSERELLRNSGGAIQLYQLQGNLAFSTTEVVVSDVLERLDGLRHIIFDLKRVLSLNESSCYLFHQLLLNLIELGVTTAFTHTERVPLLLRYLRRKFGTDLDRHVQAFQDTDRALEWGEDRVLSGHPPATPLPSPIDVRQCEVLRDLTSSQFDQLLPRLQRRPFLQGETLVEVRAAADEMFLLVEGSVSVLLDSAAGTERRLATFSPGMTFGEMALLDRSPRSARVVADTDGACYVLTRSHFEELGQLHPDILLKVLGNLCLGFSARLRKANAELAVLD